MTKRTRGMMIALGASALVLAACASAAGNGRDGIALPIAGPTGLNLQPVSAPQLNWAWLRAGKMAGSTALPPRSMRGEDEPTPALATLIIAKAQAAERVQARALLSQQQPMEYAEHCHGMDD